MLIMRYDSPVGMLLAVENEGKLTGLHFGAPKYREYTLPEDAVYSEDSDLLKQTRNWLDRYFAKEKPVPGELALSPVGGKFRQTVWKILCEIPYGEVITYGEIAKRIERETGIEKMSAQALGGAVGHNPIGIIIPCHRVVGAKGNLTGFGAGIEIKQKLLAHEGFDLSDFFVPKKKRKG